jgi:[ribosomal protein S18]-alanine N-acetyltransferase
MDENAKADENPKADENREADENRKVDESGNSKTGSDASARAGSLPIGRDLQVRPLTADDLDNVMRIEQVIYPFPWSRGNFSDSLRAGHDAWRFEDRQGRMIGYSVLMWAPDEVHLLNLSIDQACQGRRLGEQCLRWLADDVHRRGSAALLLEVRPSNLRALRLYERIGMQRIGLRRGYYPYFDGKREDAVVMRAPLPLAMPEADDAE